MQWLWFSILASVVLTVLLNVAVRLWPGATDRGARRFEDWVAEQRPDGDAGDSPSGTRVIVPWKAMVVGSIVLTVLLNLVLLLAR